MTTKKQTSTKKQTKAKAPEVGYLTHQAGSRKGTIHELFDREGPETALKRGEALGLKTSTVKTWCGTWRRQSGKKVTTPTVKVVPKEKVKAKAPAKPKPKVKSDDTAVAA